MNTKPIKIAEFKMYRFICTDRQGDKQRQLKQYVNVPIKLTYSNNYQPLATRERTVYNNVLNCIPYSLAGNNTGL